MTLLNKFFEFLKRTTILSGLVGIRKYKTWISAIAKQVKVTVAMPGLHHCGPCGRETRLAKVTL